MKCSKALAVCVGVMAAVLSLVLAARYAVAKPDDQAPPVRLGPTKTLPAKQAEPEPYIPPPVVPNDKKTVEQLIARMKKITAEKEALRVEEQQIIQILEKRLADQRKQVDELSGVIEGLKGVHSEKPVLPPRPAVPIGPPSSPN